MRLLPSTTHGLAAIAPAVVAATAFAFADVSTKVTLHAEADVLTMALFRGIVGVPLLFLWLTVGATPKPLTMPARTSVAVHRRAVRRQRLLPVQGDRGDGGAGRDPDLFHLSAADRARRRRDRRRAARASPALLAALAAFAGLALMIGAHPGGVALIGIACALISACEPRRDPADHARQAAGRRLPADHAVVADRGDRGVHRRRARDRELAAAGDRARLVRADRLSSVAMAVAVLAVFISTARIGPFRTALFMNLEPLLATIGSAIFLGEVITPLQALGGAVMIAALVAFQLRR